jgi:ribose 5-phosphate isomerase RpiB
MKIAVINEVSASLKNKDIVNALHSTVDAEIFNVGMQDPEQMPSLTYIHTGYMAAILLNTGCCDFVVGGCGTGQGFLNCVMQFPGVVCGLINEPLDAWLFSQINGGNCVSLALNKGYGWAGDINLKYIFEKLFMDPSGGGYPRERAESQKESRILLNNISEITHNDMLSILKKTDRSILKAIAGTAAFMDLLKQSDTQEAIQVADYLNNL